MYIFPDMIEMGLKEGEQFKSEDHRFVAVSIGLCNADVNGAYNIIRKSEPEAFSKVDGVGGCGLHPKIIHLEGSV